MTVFMNCIRVFVERKRLDWFLPIGALIWLVAGYFWGLFMWKWLEGLHRGPTSKPLSLFGN